MELEVTWPQAWFVSCTGGQHFLLWFCSWCFFISQRLCVNMSIWIKHIVCIYCLFTCIACKNNHSSFHVYSTSQRFLNCGSGGRRMGCESISSGALRVLVWFNEPIMGPEVRGVVCSIWAREEEFKKPWSTLYIKALEVVFQYLGGTQ